MKKGYFLLFIFYILLSISCRQKRTGIPRVLIYTNTISGPEATSIVQAILHLGEMNGFSINVTDTSTLFTDDSLGKLCGRHVFESFRPAPGLYGKNRLGKIHAGGWRICGYTRQRRNI